MNSIPILPLVLQGQIKVHNDVKIVDFTNPLNGIKIESVFEEKHSHSSVVGVGNNFSVNLYQNFFS